MYFVTHTDLIRHCHKELKAIFSITADMDLGRVFRDFILNLSTHGLRRVFYPVSSVPMAKYFRFVWPLAWSMATYYMAHQMTKTIQAYLRFETVSQVTIRQKDRVSFPAVTVCSANPLRRNLVGEWLRHCDEEEEAQARALCRDYAEEMNKIDRKYDRLPDTLLATIPQLVKKSSQKARRKTGARNAGGPRPSPDLMRKWKEITLSRQKLGRALNWNLTRYYPKIAQKLSDTVADLVVGGGKFDGDRLDAKTMEGHWKFNFHAATKRAPGGGNCYTFNMEGTLNQTHPSLDGGLIIRLTKNVSKWMEDCFETFPFQNQGGGCGRYLIMIHTPGTLPTVAHGELWDIGSYSYEYEERLNSMKPYGDCDDAYPPEMLEKYAGMERYKYSMKACFAFKYNNRLPIPPLSIDSYAENPKNVTCHSECYQRLYHVADETDDAYYDSTHEFTLEVYNKYLETKSVIQMPAVTFEQVTVGQNQVVLRHQ